MNKDIYILAGILSFGIGAYILYNILKPKRIPLPPAVEIKETTPIYLEITEPKLFQRYSGTTRKIDIKFKIKNLSNLDVYIYVTGKYKIKGPITQEGNLPKVPLRLIPEYEYSGTYSIDLSGLFLLTALPFISATGEIIIEVYSVTDIKLAEAITYFKIG